MSKSKVDPCGFGSLRVKANSILCLQCGNRIHGRCAAAKRAIFFFKEILHAENVKGILERLWNKKKGYVMKWKLVDSVSAGGGCEAAVTARTRCW